MSGLTSSMEQPHTRPSPMDVVRKGGIIPTGTYAHLDTAILEAFIHEAIKERPLLPVMQKFQDLIENDSQLYLGFHQMFEGATLPTITNYKQFILVWNKMIQEAPYYGSAGPVLGYMFLCQAMSTQAGFKIFLNDAVNKQFKAMFDVWNVFLVSPESCYVLNSDPGGWFSAPALAVLMENFDGMKFNEVFECDPSEPHYGFASWDAFFTRMLRPNVRMVESPCDDNVISAACESFLYNITQDVKKKDDFWLKGERYSLFDMLDNDVDFAEQFIGGTVFQGFLPVAGYHRWHSPVTGTVKKIVSVPGAYFAQSPALIGDQDYPYLRSLPALAAIATRMLVFIESDNPVIGLMCFIAVGMIEVSTCEATVVEGQRVTRGEELGMFHFGGSTHVLIFRPETKLHFFNNLLGDIIQLRAAIAIASA